MKQAVPTRVGRIVALAMAAAIGATLTGGVFAVATTQHRITACAAKSGGSLRLLTRGKCRATEQAVSWDQTGPTGTRGPRGLPGLQGKTGLQGQPGGVGPTMGQEVSTSTGATPPVDLGGSILTSGSFDTPSDGSVYVFAHATGAVASCSAGSTVSYGLYLDGLPVPGSAQTAALTATDLDLSGILTGVGAGSHTIVFDILCGDSGTLTGSGDSADSIGAILLGS